MIRYARQPSSAALGCRYHNQSATCGDVSLDLGQISAEPRRGRAWLAPSDNVRLGKVHNGLEPIRTPGASRGT